MKILIATLILLSHWSGLAAEESRHVKFLDPQENGLSCGSDWTWLPVTLDAAERRLLAKRSDPPKTAMDYYLLLSGKYFRNIENSLERRVAFIDRKSLSDQYLHAEYTIPSVDAGAFWVTIRLFQMDDETLIAIRHRGGNQVLYKSKDERKVKAGELIWIHLGRPEFWRFRKGEWILGDDSILPGITKEYVIDRYRNHYKAHLNHPTQKKYIALGYQLPPKGGTLQVTGRENFMSPQKKYVWAEFKFDKECFLPTTISE